jgi:hypothetical protein
MLILKGEWSGVGWSGDLAQVVESLPNKCREFKPQDRPQKPHPGMNQDIQQGPTEAASTALENASPGFIAKVKIPLPPGVWKK